MLTIVLIITIVNLLIGLYLVMQIAGGFTVLNRSVNTSTLKSEILIKKSDEIVSKYKTMTNGIINEIKGHG